MLKITIRYYKHDDTMAPCFKLSCYPTDFILCANVYEILRFQIWSGGLSTNCKTWIGYMEQIYLKIFSVNVHHVYNVWWVMSKLKTYYCHVSYDVAGERWEKNNWGKKTSPSYLIGLISHAPQAEYEKAVRKNLGYTCVHLPYYKPWTLHPLLGDSWFWLVGVTIHYHLKFQYLFAL